MPGTQLCLHRGAKVVDRRAVAECPTPPATGTWKPVSHIDVLTGVETTLQAAGFSVANEQLSLHGTARFFGILDLRSSVADGVSLAVGVRNSTNQTFPLGFCAGNRVFVCDNLSFSAELIVKRKHTLHGALRFREAIGLAVRSLGQFQVAEARRVTRLRETAVTDTQAESYLLRAFEADILSSRLLPDAIRQWRAPTVAWESTGSLWHLYNAMTLPLQGRSRSNPQSFALQTIRLHDLLNPPEN